MDHRVDARGHARRGRRIGKVGHHGLLVHAPGAQVPSVAQAQQAISAGETIAQRGPDIAGSARDQHPHGCKIRRSMQIAFT
jgi:hypothetical protein